MQQMHSLSVHDESVSEAAVLLNLSLLSSPGFIVGDAVQLIAANDSSNGDPCLRPALEHADGSRGAKEEQALKPAASLPASADLHSSQLQRVDGVTRDAIKSYMFIVRDLPLPLIHHMKGTQVSISAQVSNALGLRAKSRIRLTKADPASCHASHVEIVFRDEYLNRSDMWAIFQYEIANRTAFKGQKIWFMRTIKASVKNVYVHGQKVQSAICTHSTKPIFRSESARYVLFIQMSKEMWDFDTGGSGEVLFSRVIHGFLPELFKRWQQMNARHLVTVVLFTRLQYETTPAQGALFSGPDSENMVQREDGRHSDFYRVVVSDLASGSWADILAKLKYEFKNFLRDVSIRRPDSRIRASLGGGLASASDKMPESVISGTPCVAHRGNILEAINLASMQFSYDHVDRDLLRTGVSIAVLTPGTGFFEVDHDLLVTTTENLIANGIGIDLVCLARMPLHSIPLFKYRQSTGGVHGEAVEEAGARNGAWPGPLSHGSEQSNITQPAIASSVEDDSRLDQRQGPEIQPGAWCYGMPHWIDVSFWMSSEDNSPQRAKLPKPSDGRRKLFRPRVRTYELQMLGVLEDGMSHISIPYMMPIRRNLIVAAGTEGIGTANQRSSLTTFEQDDFKSQSLNSSLRRSPRMEAIATSANRELTQYTNKYDQRVFLDPPNGETLPAGGSLRVSNRGHARAVDPSLSNTYQRLATRSTHPSSRPDNHRESAQSDTHSTALPPAAGPKKVNEGGDPTQLVTSESKTSSGPARRHISFGPRGFGIGTSKATPSTELTAEHAKPESALGQSLRMQMSKNATVVSPTVSAGFQAATRPLSTHSMGSDRDRWEQSQSQSSDSEVQSSSRPIPIRKTTAFRISKGSHGGVSSEYKRLSVDSKPKHDEPLHGSSEHGGRLTQGSSPRREAAVVAAQQNVSNLVPEKNPWLTIVNPSNPQANINLVSRLGRWHHVFPRPLRASKIRWKSLCSPAAIPITVEETPMAENLNNDHQKLSYRIDLPGEGDMSNGRHSGLVMGLVSIRLSHGYQIVVRSQQLRQENLDVSDTATWVDGGVVELSKGSSIHKLQALEGQGVQVTCFVRRPVGMATQGEGHTASTLYRPSIRATLAETYAPREIRISAHREDLDWREVDAFVAGRTVRQPTELSEGLQPWRARFVLIPVDPPTRLRRPAQSVNEDNEEDIRRQGIRKLTQMWERFRYVPPDERRFQSATRKGKDSNPLDIVYRTRNPSSIVAAEKQLMAENAATGKPGEPLLQSELLQRSNLSLGPLAQIIQSDNIEKRHNFLDGNFSYQIAGDYRTPRPEAKTWYGSRKSIPPTPLREDGGRDFPNRPGSLGGSNVGGKSDVKAEKDMVKSMVRETEHQGADRPAAEKRTLAIALSKSMLYDVDHRKRSYRPELIDLHYDRDHNPDNCYHFRIDWMTVTSKLIEDAIVSWATSVERFGLRLVEVPLAEACDITEKHPFRAPHPVVLARQLPDRQPEHQAYLDAKTFTTEPQMEKHFYQKSLLKRLDYVLDFEAAADFPPDVDVSYFWGKPDYRYPQYIHRSGVLLAQITDDGNFLLLANRLYNNRRAAGQDVPSTEDNELDQPKSQAAPAAGHRSSPRASPFSSPMIRPKPETPLAHKPELLPTYATAEALKDKFERFCHDETVLEEFYNEILNKAPLAERRTPYLHSTIPTLGLPPSLSLRGDPPASSSGLAGERAGDF